MNHSVATFKKLWSKSHLFQIKAKIMCKRAKWGPQYLWCV